MKVLITGDWHLRSSAPENRIDDYVQTQKDKVEWILELAHCHDCDAILQPGDMTEHFPHPKMNHALISYYIERFRAFESIDVITIYGQHDSSYRIDKSNTSLNILEAAEAVYIPHIWTPIRSGVNIAGANYNETIPDVPLHHPSHTHILLTHTMISDQDYWNGHVQFGTPLWFLNKYPDYNLVVCGDNHHSFRHQEGKRHFINCGSLMRTNIDQVDHRPVVYILDTDNPLSLEQYYVPIQPSSEVFDLAKATQEKERRKESEAFVEHLEKGFGSGDLDFEKTLESLIAQEQDQGVINLIREAQNA